MWAPMALSAILIAGICNAVADEKESRQAESVVVTILSSNLANWGTVGEWGFSALVEVDGRCILFDTGNYPKTVLQNARSLGVDLSCATDVVISHFHADHNGGLIPLLEDIRPKNPDALRRIHVAEGFFLPRRRSGDAGDAEANQMIAVRKELEAAGVEIIEYSQPTEISPAVWVTGPIERNHAEKNYPQSFQVNIDGEWVEDYVPESQGLTIVTPKGPIVLLGCGHSGSVNLLEQVQRSVQDHSIYALMGGMHLSSADEKTLLWTADKLSTIGIQNLMAGHCTGIEPLMRLRAGLDLTRHTAVVGAVGTRFVYGEGIHPTEIAK
jgi:7,8-dihydropterin-6-yl-methyl-4-(beta-D-ribofuranosyl)aminobenzene 5'-phosphate synthase